MRFTCVDIVVSLGRHIAQVCVVWACGKWPLRNVYCCFFLRHNIELASVPLLCTAGGGAGPAIQALGALVGIIDSFYSVRVTVQDGALAALLLLVWHVWHDGASRDMCPSLLLVTVDCSAEELVGLSLFGLTGPQAAMRGTPLVDAILGGSWMAPCCLVIGTS